MAPSLQALLHRLAILSRKPAPRAADRCGSCRHFRNHPAYLEAMMPGLSSLSSAFASVRADDGLCLRHDLYIGARGTCADFAAMTEES